MKQIVVVKVGGAHLDNPQYLDQLAIYLQNIRDKGHQIVLVHGGGKEISKIHEVYGLPFIKKAGLRVTPPESMALVSMVLCGLVNKRLVSHMNRFNLKAVGLSGVDFHMMKSDLLNEREYGRVGGPPRVITTPLCQLLKENHLIVLAPVCAGPDGAPVNVNADVSAQAVAIALKAKRLDFVTDVQAVKTQEGPRQQLQSAEVPKLIEDEIVQGGMIPKLTSGIAALEGGVSHVRVGNISSLTHNTATEVTLS